MIGNQLSILSDFFFVLGHKVLRTMTAYEVMWVHFMLDNLFSIIYQHIDEIYKTYRWLLTNIKPDILDLLGP